MREKIWGGVEKREKKRKKDRERERERERERGIRRGKISEGGTEIGEKIAEMAYLIYVLVLSLSLSASSFHSSPLSIMSPLPLSFFFLFPFLLSRDSNDVPTRGPSDRRKFRRIDKKEKKIEEETCCISFRKKISHRCFAFFLSPTRSLDFIAGVSVTRPMKIRLGRFFSRVRLKPSGVDSI